MEQRWKEIQAEEAPKYCNLHTDEVLVWIDEAYYVVWETMDYYEPKDWKRWQEVLGRSGIVQAIPSDHLDKERRLNFKILVGEGIARGLKHHYDNALEVLNSAEKYVLARNREASRYWYIEASLRTTGVVFLVGLFCWLGRNWMIAAMGRGVFCLVLTRQQPALWALNCRLSCAWGRWTWIRPLDVGRTTWRVSPESWPACCALCWRDWRSMSRF